MTRPEITDEQIIKAVHEWLEGASLPLFWPEDEWHVLSPSLDLNMWTEGGEEKLTAYPVVNRQTITNGWSLNVPVPEWAKDTHCALENDPEHPCRDRDDDMIFWDCESCKKTLCQAHGQDDKHPDICDVCFGKLPEEIG